jgi:hypothetical protein
MFGTKDERSAARAIVRGPQRQGEDRMKLFAVLLMTLPLYVACEKQGPLARAGEEIDEAVQDVKNGGETLGNKVDDAVDEVRDGVSDAADELKK